MKLNVFFFFFYDKSRFITARVSTFEMDVNQLNNKLIQFSCEIMILSQINGEMIIVT